MPNCRPPAWAALWAAKGHKVKFVAATNGDIGHFSQAGGPLAIRRTAEVQECARILGITTDVLDIHDGELEPNLATRQGLRPQDPGLAGRHRHRPPAV